MKYGREKMVIGLGEYAFKFKKVMLIAKHQMIQLVGNLITENIMVLLIFK